MWQQSMFWQKLDIFSIYLPPFHLFMVSTGMVQVCEHVTCLDPCSWNPHNPNMSIRYREPSPGTETEEEPWVYKVTSSTTKGNLNVSALSDSDPTNSSHPPTKTKIKLFSFIECTKKFPPKVFRLHSQFNAIITFIMLVLCYGCVICYYWVL